eukprot:TRINITY_DN10480_c0_g3_i1.p1 TRINITY_DN10480_c0_g3~~TRINITY_DN10480_c0_g3_i1.p1  ORF type:complete len:196 (+),score=36.76 TRINITY_DN10480_c0_g3_i1:61-648(+)
MDLGEATQLIATLVKENRSLAAAVKEVDSSNAQECELLRESLKANAQIAAQIQAEFDKLLFTHKGSEKFKKAEREFQLGCRTLESLAEKILHKEQEHNKFEGRTFEQVPLLKESNFDELEEDKTEITVTVEGKLCNRTVLLQEAYESLRHIDRMCSALNGIVLNKPLEKAWNRNPIKESKKTAKKNRNERLSYLK